nr:immunoglobulin light chain junction region [Macaca mulatta]
CQQHYSCPYSF